jgi:hypothetical protein
MIAFEIGHYLKRRTKGKIGMASMKIDMMKAYDRIEWEFLKHMLKKLGFATNWVNLIMLFVTSVKYKIWHLGEEFGEITPSRGLRQGDPISLYLFLLVAEGLSSFLQLQFRRGNIHGCKVTKSALDISHLIFADDSFLFFRATDEEANIIKNYLHIYEITLGQKVNYNKSSIVFSPNTKTTTQDSICNILSVNKVWDHGKYLCAPSLIGRNKKDVFSFIKEKVWKRLNGWQAKFFSRAGKEVLIKSVIQAIPSYIILVFLLPVDLCATLERMMNNFWWRTNKGIHWRSWKNPDKDFLEAGIGNNASFIWRGLISTQDLIRKGTRWKIGNGNNVRIWGDSWLLDPDYPALQSTPIQR